MTQKSLSHPLLTPDILRLFDIFENHIRLVGGAVRDYLMNRPIHDIDLTTPLKPEMILKKLHQHKIATYETGLQHGTITAVINHTAYEITTLRQDVKTDGRHAIVSFVEDYEADAFRRDLTINALYMDRNGTVFDYINGLKDIQKSRIRFIGTPSQRVQEDYLRILRFFRFYALYGKGQPDIASLEACQHYQTGLKTISIERKQDEFMRLLSAPHPIKTLTYMQKIGLFDTLNLPVNIPLLSSFLKQMPKSTALQRLAILAPDICLSDFRFSNVQTKLFNIYQTTYDFNNLSECRFLLWKLGKESFLFHLNKFCLEKPLSKAEKQKIKRLRMPVFPITGKEIADLGFYGREIGQQLETAKNLWRDLDFCRKKKLVLKKLLIYNQEKIEKSNSGEG